MCQAHKKLKRQQLKKWGNSKNLSQHLKKPKTEPRDANVTEISKGFVPQVSSLSYLVSIITLINCI